MMEAKTGVIAGVLIAVVGIAGAWYLRSREAPAPPQPAPDPVPVAPPPDAGPPLSIGDGDALLRQRAGETGSKLLASWAGEPGILQRIAAAVRLVARGDSPAPVISFIDIQGEMRPVQKGNRLYISPASYARYDAITGAFTAIDPAFAGRAYAELRPYFDLVYADVAAQGERFDTVLAAAIDRLINVPVPEGPAEIVEKGAIYAFRDPALESLKHADKHVLRMGPKNAKAFQEFLRKFKESAGLK